MGDGGSKIVCADRFYISPEALNILEEAGEVLWSDSGEEDDLVKTLSGAVVLISEYFKVTPRVLDASQRLRGVVVWGAGYDHVDVEAASKRGIYVANTSGSNAESVAEQVFSFILALSRSLFRADAFVRSGEWTGVEESSLPESLLGNDVYGKILSVIGLGNIGRRVARIAHGFNIRVLAHDPYVPHGVAEEWGVELCTLDEALTGADYVTLHTVLSEETRGLIGLRELDLMKPTAFLINASRGAIVDQTALVEALKEGMIAGAALDVFEEEPLEAENPLLYLDNVILTPHYAGNSREALEATSMMVVEEVARILMGSAPLNLVNRRQLNEHGFLTQLNKKDRGFR